MNEAVKEKKKWYLKWWAIVMYVFIIGIIFSASEKTSPVVQTAETSIPPQTQTEKKPEVIKISATKLAQAYIDNEVNADNLYKGKTLEISGTIKDIGKDILDTPYVAINGNPSDYFTDVQCMFGKEDLSLLGTLKKGSSIVVQGNISGKLGNVFVQECKIVK